jgi:hypothetical protein
VEILVKDSPETSTKPTESSNRPVVDCNAILSRALRVWSRLKLPNDPTDGQGEKAITELLLIYIAALSDLGPKRLAEACDVATRRAKFFPKPADIRELVEQTEEDATILEADAAWHAGMNWIRDSWHPDVHYLKNARELAPEIEHALSAAGGVPYLWEHSGDRSGESLQFAKRRFVDAYIRTHDLQARSHLLGHRQATQILENLAGRNAQKILSAPQPPRTDELTPEELTPEELGEKCGRVAARARGGDREQLSGADQKARLDAWLREHGLAPISEQSGQIPVSPATQ